ncbi:S8 family serine peptidase [Nitrogeniibacter mangrovi]|uniref:S8 family serine peptidase n=1 Tax=Nitrogeniibacter mangrovi TaxID=2016596 RepID=A0A6C1B4G9_9RHOO|nr:S8 family serine peptidase [Nitrogeniibacter mangrovi]QID17668.1 S8 family serine peptidase [Nitrogeniibacter mangrovi]
MTARIVAQLMFCLLVAASVPVFAGDTDPAEMPKFETQEEYINWMYEHAPNVDSFTIKLKPGKEPRPRAGLSQKLLDELSVLTGVKLRFWVLGGADDWQRIRMDHYMTQKDAEAIAEKLATHPDIESAGVDGRLYPMSDARAAEQWSFQAGPGAANIAKAWNIATGSSDVVVAVIDTGIASHEDIDPSRVLPGYDMITRSEVAADGDGRDNDPSDQGDWVTVFESASAGVLFGCKVTNSSWHGTHVTGIIGATADNAIGIHGVDSAAKLMPMRALGECGGEVPDAADAITWPSGRDVFGAGKSSTKASVLNMSVSGRGACPPALKAAIQQAVLDGITVVAAAGNKSVNADFYPANCPGVITVVANDSLGKRATYSNFGGDVTVSSLLQKSDNPLIGESTLSHVRPAPVERTLLPNRWYGYGGAGQWSIPLPGPDNAGRGPRG